MRMDRMLCLGACVVLTINVATAWATVYHVGGEQGKTATAPASAPATLKDLAQAQTKLSSGDELVIHPGTYRESLVLKGLENVTIRSAGPGVVFDGRYVLSEGDFEPLAGSEKVLVSKKNMQVPILVFVDGKLLAPRIDKKTRDPRGGFGFGESNLSDGETNLWIFRDEKLQINLGGPLAGRHIQITGRDAGISLEDCRNCRIVGLTLEGYVSGIDVGGIDNVVQDCLLRQNMDGVRLGGRHSQVRKCTFIDNDRHGVSGGGERHKIEQSYFLGNGHDAYDKGRYYKAGIKFNHGKFYVIANNLMIDNAGSGVIWGDIDCVGELIYNNSIAWSPTNGFYIEYTQRQNFVAYNTIMSCKAGVTFRTADNNIVRDNWIFDYQTAAQGVVPMASKSQSARFADMKGVVFGDTTVAQGTQNNFVTNNLIQVSGVSVNVPGRDVDPGMFAGDTGGNGRDLTDEEKAKLPKHMFMMTNHMLGNYYTRPALATSTGPATQDAGSAFAEVYGNKYPTLEAFQKATGWEDKAKLGEFGPEVIWKQKPTWWLAPQNVDASAPVAVLLNGTFDIRNCGDENETPMGWYPTFWEDSLVKWSMWHRHNGVTPNAAHKQSVVLAFAGAAGRGAVARVIGLKPDEMPKGGAGWRGMMLPVREGDTIELSFDVMAKELSPADGGAVKAGLIFSDWTGNIVGASWVIDPKSNLGTGSYEWTRASGAAVVPAGANRVQIFLGVDRCTGTIDFDALEMSVKSGK